MTRSPGCRRSTRTRCRVSAASKTTRSPEIRSGEIVKRRTAPERGPAFDRQRVLRGEAVRSKPSAHLVGFTVEDTAQEQRAAGRQQPAIARRQADVGGGEEIGEDERSGRRVEDGGLATSAG